MSERGEILDPFKVLNVASWQKLRASRGEVHCGPEAVNLRPRSNNAFAAGAHACHAACSRDASVAPRGAPLNASVGRTLSATVMLVKEGSHASSVSSRCR